MKSVLITGATGDVGTHLARELAGKYKLRLSDRRPLKAKNFIKADISKMADCLRITKGVDAIVHLGGYSVEGPWESILQANIIGCYNVFEAARRNGVKRIVFPTSNHATGFYRRDQTIDHRVYPKPDSRYGVSKVFGEALGSLYADKYGMEMYMVRIGNVHPFPLDKRRLSIWISPRDIAQLVSIGIDHPGIKFEIVYGVSGNKRSWYDNSNAARLGYRPQDDAESYAQEVLAKEKPSDNAIADAHQGGIFCTAEDVPNPAAPQKAAKGKGRRNEAQGAGGHHRYPHAFLRRRFERRAGRAESGQVHRADVPGTAAPPRHEPRGGGAAQRVSRRQHGDARIRSRRLATTREGSPWSSRARPKPSSSASPGPASVRCAS